MSTAEQQQGRFVGPYRIEGRLGTGGQGEVYRAYDDRLARWVALRPIRTGTEPRVRSHRRLVRGARSVAQLNHPTIVQVHDILEAEDRDWIVMELVEGRSLREVLASGGLRPEIALAFAEKLASGLVAAHALGIVHRDLRSEKIVVTANGRPKILDFGLAGDPSFERQRPAISPEQASGQAVDPRTDLFALGAVLYELLTGRAPFAATGALEAAEKVTAYQPPPPSTIADLPPEVDELVSRLLAKQPENRPQTAAEVHLELRQILVQMTGEEELSDLGLVPLPGTDASAKEKRRRLRRWAALGAVMVAVLLALWQQAQGPRVVATLGILPFTFQGDEENAYSATWLEEEIAQRLAEVEGLRVARIRVPGTGSSFHDERGKDTDVDYTLGASIRWLAGGEKVKVHTELNKIADRILDWSDTFSRPLADVPSLPVDVTKAVIARLQTQIPIARPPEDVGTSSPEARRFYEQGLVAGDNAYTKAEVDRAVDLLEHAVELDPQFAKAAAALSDMYLAYRDGGFDLAPGHLRLARRWAERALQLRPGLPEGLLALGSCEAAEGFWREALAAFKSASKGHADAAEVELRTACVLRRQGHYELARRRLTAPDSTPRSPAWMSQLAAVDADQRRFVDARNHLDEALRQLPDQPALLARRLWLEVAADGPLPAAIDLALLPPAVAAWVAILERQPEQALQWLAGAPPLIYDEKAALPRDLIKGWALSALGRQGQTAFEAARRLLEAEVALTRDPRAIAGLAACLAELGQAQEATAQAEVALGSAALERDGVLRSGVTLTVAGALHRAGEQQRAAELVRRLIDSSSGGVTSALVAAQPLFRDPGNLDSNVRKPVPRSR